MSIMVIRGLAIFSRRFLICEFDFFKKKKKTFNIALPKYIQSISRAKSVSWLRIIFLLYLFAIQSNMALGADVIISLSLRTPSQSHECYISHNYDSAKLRNIPETAKKILCGNGCEIVHFIFDDTHFTIDGM